MSRKAHVNVGELSNAVLIDSILFDRRADECRRELLDRDWTDAQIDRAVAAIREDMDR